MERLILTFALLFTMPASAAPAALVMRNTTDKVVDGGTYSTVYLANCSRCVVKNVTVTPPPAANINSQAVRIVNSPGALIDNVTITGQVATTGTAETAPGPAGNVIGRPAGEGIHIEGSPGATLSHNRIDGFHQGITFGKSPNLTIIKNTVTNTRTSPIAGGVDDGLTITGNILRGSYPWRWGQRPAGDHADFIHMWTYRGSVSKITVSGNTIDQADGAAILGIVFQNKRGDFNDVLVEGNKITLGQGQAIVLRGVNGAVNSNTLVSLDPKGNGGRNAARYNVFAPSVLTARGNIGPIIVDKRPPVDQRATVTMMQ